MSRTYNQQNSDGSWTQVTANDDGTYTSVPISDPTSGAAPAADPSYSYDPGAASAATSATNAATAVADQKARQAFSEWEMRTGDQRLAFEKANEAWSESFRQSQANNANALDWLGLAAKLSGPANAFEYAKTLTGTPGGLADIVRAAGGAYRLPSFGGGSGGASVPLSIESVIRDVGAYSPTAQGAPTAPAPTSSGQFQTSNGPKTLDQMAAELKVANPGGTYTDPATIQSVYASTTKGQVTPMAANVNTSGSHTMLPSPQEPAGGGYIPAFGALPTSGNQWAPSFVNSADPSQMELFGAAYGDQGRIFGDLQAQYRKSLRAYGGPTRGYSSF